MYGTYILTEHCYKFDFFQINQQDLVDKRILKELKIHILLLFHSTFQIRYIHIQLYSYLEGFNNWKKDAKYPFRWKGT